MREDSSTLLSPDTTKKIPEPRTQPFFKTARKIFFELNENKAFSAWNLLKTNYNEQVKGSLLTAPIKIIQSIRNRSPFHFPGAMKQATNKSPSKDTETLLY